MKYMAQLPRRGSKIGNEATIGTDFSRIYWHHKVSVGPTPCQRGAM